MDDIRVAIVEDLNEIREALRVLINGSQGFSCFDVFENGESALADLPSKQIDVVVMDINMPGMSGVDCIVKLKPIMPDTQFMIYTVYDNDENIFAALKGGATGYILKRTSPAGMLESIRELMAGGSPMSGEVARRVVASLQNKNKANESVEILSPREKEILDYLSKGYLYKEIASALFISKDTVKKHIQHIYEKLHVQNKMDALNKVFH